MGFKVTTVSAVGLLAVLTACSDGSTTGAPASTTTGAAATSSSATPSGPAAGTCPVGSYEVTTISGKAGRSVNGVPIVATSAGGLRLTLTDSAWTLSGDGATVTLEAAGVAVDAAVTGAAEGSYVKSGADYLFRQEKASGKVTLKTPVAGISSFSMDEVGPALAPDGKATLTCGPDTLKITSESVGMDLKAIGSAGPGPVTTTTTGASSGGGTGGTLSIEESALTRTIDCAGRDVALNGSANKLTFTGSCGTVSINGSRNELTLATVGRLAVNGSLNKITYTGSPQISNNGTGNTIARG